MTKDSRFILPEIATPPVIAFPPAAANKYAPTMKSIQPAKGLIFLRKKRTHADALRAAVSGIDNFEGIEKECKIKLWKNLSTSTKAPTIKVKIYSTYLSPY